MAVQVVSNSRDTAVNGVGAPMQGLQVGPQQAAETGSEQGCCGPPAALPHMPPLQPADRAWHPRLPLLTLCRLVSLMPPWLCTFAPPRKSTKVGVTLIDMSIIIWRVSFVSSPKISRNTASVYCCAARAYLRPNICGRRGRGREQKQTGGVQERREVGSCLRSCRQLWCSRHNRPQVCLPTQPPHVRVKLPAGAHLAGAAVSGLAHQH